MQETSEASSSNTEQPRTEIDAEYALSDSIDIVLQHLSIRDLCRVALVNRAWYRAAKRELSKRGPKFINLPSFKIRFPDFVTSKPRLTILFGPKNMTKESINEYRVAFPNLLVTIGTDTLRLDNELICETSDDDHRGLLGLMIPQIRNIRILVSSERYYGENEGFVEKFLPDVSEGKATILLFTRPDNTDDVMKILKRCMKEKNQRFSLWGKHILDKIFISTNDKEKKGMPERIMALLNYDYTQFFILSGYKSFAMSITGRGLNSFSTVIDSLTNESELTLKLTEFKEKLKLKRCTIGMACGPKYVKDSSRNILVDDTQLMDTLKQVFPTIPFAGVFEGYGIPQFYGNDSTIDDPDQELVHTLVLSLLIITYD